MKQRPSALLLIGPTGAGKTPLGARLEASGLGGRRCVHFDFGQNMRQAVTAGPTRSILSSREIAFLRDVLDTGVLLEDKDFPIAARLLEDFIDRQATTPETQVVLNGLPRHAGQATRLDPIVDVRTIVHLRCTPETVTARIAANTGGDRTGRDDDDTRAIGRKLELFAQRTLPLVDHYRQQGATIVKIDVDARMTAAEMATAIEHHGCASR